MGTPTVPAGVERAIGKLWPDRRIERFDTEESYFHGIRTKLEKDLCGIPGAVLRWQTPEEDFGGAFFDDDEFEEPPSTSEWQSYHLFFLSPTGEQFRFDTETEAETEEDDGRMCRGTGWYGIAAGVCLGARVATTAITQYEYYEEASPIEPQLDTYFYDDKTGDPADSLRAYHRALGEARFEQIEKLRGEVANVLAKYRLLVIDETVGALEVPGLRADPEILAGKRLRVQDAFFFRCL